MPYFDDIIIYSKNLLEHKEHLKEAFDLLKKAGIVLNKKKSQIAQEKVKILGYIIEKGSIKPDPEKISAICEASEPETIKGIRSFLGTTNLFRDFIPQLAHFMTPINNLLKGFKLNSDAAVKWDKESKKAFTQVKALICENVIRYQPDLSKEFIVLTDASDRAIGGLLTQETENGGLQTIYAFSKSLDKAQLNYSVTDKELLAIVKSLERFKHFLLGRTFKLKTDHKALEYLWSCKNPPSRMLRWANKLQEFNFTIEHIEGEKNPSDFLSRLPEPKIAKSIASINTEDKNKILNEYHLALGHGSSSNMKFAIAKKYNWPEMYKEIDEYVEKCQTCLKSGGEVRNTKYKAIETTSPNELWEVDIIGYLDKTRKGYRYIITVIDHYDKWIEAKGIRSKDMNSVADYLRAIINQNGVPKTIYSDNGLEFNNQIIQRLAEEYQIKWIYNSPGHHNSIGAIERANQTLMNKLRKLSAFGRNDWAEELENAVKATNISFNRSIRSSPYMLRKGRLPDLNVDILNNKTNIKLNKNLIKNLRNENIQQYKSKEIEKGKIIAPSNYNIGDKVLVYRKILGDKLASMWTAGFTITKKLEHDGFLISNNKSVLKANKVHLKLDTSV